MSGLSDEEIILFKELIFNNMLGTNHKQAGTMMETLYDYSIDILNKRVPVEGTSVKID